MYGGFSGCNGMVIYNTNIKGDNAIYGYKENGEIRYKIGTREGMRELQKESEVKSGSVKSKETKIMAITFLVMLVIVIISFITTSFFHSLMVLLFCIGAYFPMLVVAFANMDIYGDAEAFQQFRRYHGTEHAMVHMMTKEKEATMDNIKSSPYYDSECGTAYAGYALTLLTLLVCMIINISTMGLGKLILIFMAAVVILLINIFNPYNPYLLLQRHVVDKPTDEEYEFGLQIIDIFRKEIEEREEKSI